MHQRGLPSGPCTLVPNPRSRSALANTDTLDSDIAALASTGDSCQLVHG
jgi:hypothetical protein